MKYSESIDDYRYYEHPLYPKKDIYIHIDEKKFFEDNRYSGYLYYFNNYKKEKIYVGDFILKDKKFVMDGKCELYIEDNEGYIYTGEMKNGKKEGYGIVKKKFKNEDNKEDIVVYELESIWKDNKKQGYAITKNEDGIIEFLYNNDEMFYSKMDSDGEIKYYNDKKEVKDENEIKKIEEQLKKEKDFFEKKKSAFNKASNKKKYLFKMYKDQKIIYHNNEKEIEYTPYLFCEYKEQKDKQIPEGRGIIYFYDNGTKFIYIDGKWKDGVLIEGIKYDMKGNKKYQGEFKTYEDKNEEKKQDDKKNMEKKDGLGMYYDNGEPHMYGNWEENNFKTGIRKYKDCIEIGNFSYIGGSKMNRLFKGIRITNNKEKQCCDIEYENISPDKKIDIKNLKNYYKNINEIDKNFINALVKTFLLPEKKDFNGTNIKEIVENFYKICEEEKEKTRKNIKNEQSNMFLQEFREKMSSKCCCIC